ncbi:MAG: homoserine dehydrogenase [Candidatus Wukongarchaeota archaeon]|nr:homoserine dehydrogenase [Candidatus Wukongarchaeota archaeon]MDO8128135.1 homoserine dehydrogenase [Candidatus Wukongarchaeota archaeon]
MADVRIILVGFGTVGKGFLNVVLEKKSFLKEIYGLNLHINAVFKSDGGFISNTNTGLDIQSLLSIKDYKEHPQWVKDAKAYDKIPEMEADIVVELTPTNIGDGEPGLGHIRQALKSGKDVVTANKGPLVVAFQELITLAEENKRFLHYEGAVGGAIPVFSLARENLKSSKIISIEGILNGTTNFILSRMVSEKIPFEIALKEAQELGYAERDPSYDIDGIDAAGKLLILTNTILRRPEERFVKFDEIKIESIRNITQEAVELAEENNLVIKHVASAKEGKLEVGPKLLPKTSPLAVSSTLNSITFKSDLAGEITIIGEGAGGRETASAVLTDIITIFKKRIKTKNNN